jgi:outer membrane protein OmpA-like peptidoglycan-associated protein
MIVKVVKAVIRLTLCAPLLSMGCSSKSVRVDINKKLVPNSIACVAVPVFNNFSQTSSFSGEIVADLVGEELFAKGGIDTIQRGSVSAALRLQNINLSKNMTLPEAIWLGRTVGADAILVGQVSEYDYQYSEGLPVGNPSVAISAKLVVVKNKEVVWAGSVTRSGRDLFEGKRDPLSRVAMSAVRELLNTLSFGQNTGDQPVCDLKTITLDIDDDGVLNLADKCPTRAETFNGIEDNDGCPEIARDQAEFIEFFSVDGDRILLKQPVFFTGSAVDPSSHPLLRAIARFLIDNPEIRKVMIEGFSLVGANKQFQERAAFKRASNVKQFLLAEGVEESRLVAVGYGFESKRANGSIELTIVE